MQEKGWRIIMAQTNISIRIDEDVKREAESLFSNLGLTLSSATNVFFRQAIRTQGIPFPLSINTPTNPIKEDALAKGLLAMNEAHKQAAINGTSKMTLDDINDIINECRQENEKL